jgi:hypothetical protein
MDKKLYKNRDWLYSQYITLQKPISQIGREQNVTMTPISNWLKKFNIPIRSRGGVYCEKVKRECRNCGKTFFVKPSVAKKGWGVFCSRECQAIGKVEENAWNWQGGKIKRICGICGKTFFVKRHIKQQGRGIYCSMKCMSSDMSGENNPMYSKCHTVETKEKIRQSKIGKQLGKNNPSWKGGLIEKVCEICGETFLVKRSHAGQRTCSPKCGAKIKSGENNCNWQGGISNIPYPFEFNDELKQRIRTRDRNVCQLCKRTMEENGRELPVHHIDYDKQHCNDENLITLCNSCNAKVNFQRGFWTGYFVGLQARRVLHEEDQYV